MSEKDKEYHRNYMKKYRQDKPLKVKGHKLKSRYGITLGEFNALFAKQLGVCAICKISEATHVDHCHSTKKVRGLLCTFCNTGIGALKDNITFIGNAITYLESN